MARCGRVDVDVAVVGVVILVMVQVGDGKYEEACREASEENEIKNVA